MERVCFKEAGFRGLASSKVCEMVVVAVANEPGLPRLRVCSNMGSGVSRFEDVASEEGPASEEGSVMEVVVATQDSSGLVSRLTRGVPVVMIVATD